MVVGKSLIPCKAGCFNKGAFSCFITITYIDKSLLNTTHAKLPRWIVFSVLTFENEKLPRSLLTFICLWLFL